MQVPYGDEECNMNEYHLCNKETIVRALDCRCTYTGAFQLQLYSLLPSKIDQVELETQGFEFETPTIFKP